MHASTKLELSHRQSDGIDVTLWWSPTDDSVSVEVLEFETATVLELQVVDRTRALDAFYHPYAYAALGLSRARRNGSVEPHSRRARTACVYQTQSRRGYDPRRALPRLSG
jgi:hypothetical protein